MTEQADPADNTLVLVVDDEPVVRDMLNATLTRAGYRVILASDGQTAIAALGTATPDLILTDVFMPNCDGIELLRSSRLRRAGTPVIAMSGGYAGLDMLDATAALGAVATINKPFRPGELLDLMRTLCGSGSGSGRQRPSDAAAPGHRVLNAGANV